MLDQTPDERARGVLRLTLGAAAIRVAVLPIRRADAWIERVQRTAAESEAGDGLEVVVELIAAYAPDLEGAWVEEHASNAELLEAIAALQASALPYQPSEPLPEGGRRIERAEMYEWAFATWGTGPAQLEETLTYGQLHELWSAGQLRLARDRRERRADAFVGARDGVAAAMAGSHKVFGATGLPEYAQPERHMKTDEDLFRDFGDLVRPRTEGFA